MIGTTPAFRARARATPPGVHEIVEAVTIVNEDGKLTRDQFQAADTFTMAHHPDGGVQLTGSATNLGAAGQADIALDALIDVRRTDVVLDDFLPLLP